MWLLLWFIRPCATIFEDTVTIPQKSQFGLNYKTTKKKLKTELGIKIALVFRYRPRGYWVSSSFSLPDKSIRGPFFAKFQKIF